MNLQQILKPFWKGIVPEPFNYPYVRGIPNALYGTKATIKQSLLFLVGFLPIVRSFFIRPLVSERIVEDPFVIGQITNFPKGSKILDFGCYSSLLPLELASLGYKVTGIDLCDYPYKHPNFTFYKTDILDNKFSPNSFDCIYAVSSLEHVGVGWYPQEKFGITDKKVVEEFYRLLKPQGKLIVTVPFGRRKFYPYFRVYDRKQLLSLFEGFVLVVEKYFLRDSDTVWKISTIGQIVAQFNKKPKVEAVACWVLKKTR